MLLSVLFFLSTAGVRRLWPCHKSWQLGICFSLLGVSIGSSAQALHDFDDGGFLLRQKQRNPSLSVLFDGLAEPKLDSLAGSDGIKMRGGICFSFYGDTFY